MGKMKIIISKEIPDGLMHEGVSEISMMCAHNDYDLNKCC